MIASDAPLKNLRKLSERARPPLTEGKVHHLVAKELRDRSDLLGALRVESHDFH